jgi:hypothetical protein
MSFNLSFRMKKLPRINGKYMEEVRKRKHLHSKFGPLSTVVVIFGLVILIGLDLLDKSKHATVDGILDDTFKLAVNVISIGISLETMPHLGSNKYYNQQIKRKTYGCGYESYGAVRYLIPKIIRKHACQCVLASIKKVNANVAETWVC